MTKLKKLLFLIAVIYGISSNVSAQNYSDQDVLMQAERISGDKFTFRKKTSKGAIVYSERKLDKQFLKSIDQGLTDLFAVARKNGYNLKLNYSDYTIFIANPDRLNDADGNYSPGFSISVRQYAGSIFDKGGYMYVAGMVISNNPCAFLITDENKEFNRISDVVRYEGEHLVLFHNDRKRYNQTADHSKGGSHPILN
jgi:hypothetical protein